MVTSLLKLALSLALSFSATLALAQGGPGGGPGPGPVPSPWLASGSLAYINNNAAAMPSPLSGTMVQVQQADSIAGRYEIDTAAQPAFITGTRVNGTRAAPLTLNAGNELTSFNAYGYNGAAMVGPVVAFRTYAAETFASGHQGSYARVATTAIGSTTLTDQLGIENDGGLTVPPTVTGGSKGPGTINVGLGIYVGGVPILGPNAPTFTPVVTITGNATTLPSPSAGTDLQIASADGVATRIQSNSFGALSAFTFARANGTNAAPTALLANQTIGGVNAVGYNGVGYGSSVVGISLSAAQNWTSSAEGTYIIISTTPLGSITSAEGVRFQPSSGVSIGTTAFNAIDPGAGNLAVQGNVSAAVGSGFYLGSVQTLFQSGNGTIFADLSGNFDFYAGDAADPANYYNNTTHVFRNRASSSIYAEIGSFGLAIFGSTSGDITIAAPPIAGGGTWLLPAASDTFVGVTLASSPTNKTFASSTDVIGGVTMTLGSDATGDIYYRNSSGILTRLPIGSGSQFLGVSGGVPAWGAPAGSGTVMSVAAGAGMNFTTITGTGSVAIDKATAANFYAGTANKVLTADNVFTAEVVVAFSGTQTLDFSTFLNASITLTANITSLTCSNMKAGQSGAIRFLQDGTGTRTMVSTWCAAFIWAGGTKGILSTPASSDDALFYQCISSSVCLVSLGKAFL